MTRRPRIARLIVCLLLAGATLLSTAAPLGAAARTPATAGDADRVRRELEDARRDLSQVEERETVTLADLRAVDARRTRLARELDRLGADLDDAERRQARAQRELAGTTARLLDVDRRVDDGRRRLRGQQAALRRTARTAYHYGAAAPLVLTAGDPGDFVRGLGYLRMANRARRSSMAAVQEVRAGLDESGAQLAVLRDRQADQRAALQGARAQVAGRLADRQRLGAELTQELDRHRTILAGIERDEAQVRALVDDLTAQDERIHAELAAAAQRAEIEAPPALAGGPSGGSSGPALTIPAAPARAPAWTDGLFTFPTRGTLGNRRFGWQLHPISKVRKLHAGWDIAAPSGTPIWAAADGVVVGAGWRGGYGNAVVIDHGGGLATLSAHQSRLAVAAGQRVRAGEVIGYVGSTGLSTGPHLHFEVRRDGTAVDPTPYVRR